MKTNKDQDMNTHKQLVPPTGALEEVLDALEATIWQDCGKVDSDVVDSMFITLHAEAIRTLAKYGRVLIKYDNGGREVYGIFTNPQAW
jgi:hypothetical protein